MEEVAGEALSPPVLHGKRKAYLGEILSQRFHWIRARMEGDYIFGGFTASDAFVYVMLRWAMMEDVEVPRELQELAHRIECRDAVRTVLSAEEAEPLRGAA